MPNSKLIQKEVQNLTLHDNHIWAHIEFYVSPDSKIEEVEKVETDKGTLYELELESPDDKHLEIYFDKQGKIIASEN